MGLTLKDLLDKYDNELPQEAELDEPLPKKYSSLDGFVPRVGRKNGNTTRQVDFYIDRLFTFGNITIKDHSQTVTGDLELKDRIIDRLENEHGGLVYKIVGNKIIVVK